MCCVLFAIEKGTMRKQTQVQKAEPSVIVGRDEMNLAEFALGLASDRNLKECKTIERSQTSYLPDGTRVDQTWTITGSDKHGLPRAGDDDILLAVIKLAFDQGLEDRRVHFSRYEILELLELDHKGRNYDRIEDALQRLSGVRILAKNAFWDNSRKSYISTSFGIIDNYRIIEGNRKLNSQPEMPFTYINFNEEFFNSMKAGNVKRLDMNFYNGLKSSIAKRLYRYLDKRRYRKPIFSMDVHTLAIVNLGLDVTRDTYFSQIKQRLEVAHNELHEKGFLGDWEYRQTRDRSTWQVHYNFEKIRQEAIQEPKEEKAPSNPLETSLIARGIGGRVAASLVRQHGDRIKAKIDMFDHLTHVKSPLLAKNPVGWLRKAIEDDYTHVPGYISPEERILKAEKAKQREQAAEQDTTQERTHNEKIWQHYLALPTPEQDALLEAVKAQYSFLSPDKRQHLTPDTPLVKSALIALLERQSLCR